MKMDTTDEWNEVYTETNPVPASEVLTANKHLLPMQGNALDIACGMAENALLLAELGFFVDAWDNSAVAVRKVNDKARKLDLSVQAQVLDLSVVKFPVEKYDVIVFTHYLDQMLSKAIVGALKPGGLLFYQTFTREKVSHNGPQDPVYRLKANEILTMFPELSVVVYREEGRIGDLDSGFRDKAMLVGKKPLYRTQSLAKA